MDGMAVAQPWGQLGLWLESPVLDWDVSLKILKDVKTLCKKYFVKSYPLTHLFEDQK